MSMTNGEKDSLLGQTVLPPELGQILGGLVFLGPPFTHGGVAICPPSCGIYRVKPTQELGNRIN